MHLLERSLKKRALLEGAKHGWGLLLVQRSALYETIATLYREHTHLNILEVGAYKGFLVGWLHENFPKNLYSWDYYGVDIVEPGDRRRDYPHLIMNAEALEFPANSFHLVVMIEVLEHVVDYVRALREAYRVLVPGGALFVQSVVCSDPTALGDETHFHVLHPETLSRLLGWLGFTRVRVWEGGNFAVAAWR